MNKTVTSEFPEPMTREEIISAQKAQSDWMRKNPNWMDDYHFGEIVAERGEEEARIRRAEWNDSRCDYADYSREHKSID